jgi:hypothetical protein
VLLIFSVAFSVVEVLQYVVTDEAVARTQIEDLQRDEQRPLPLTR